MMNKLRAQKLISILVYSGGHMGVMYRHNGSNRNISFNNDVYYYKICIISNSVGRDIQRVDPESLRDLECS